MAEAAIAELTKIVKGWKIVDGAKSVIRPKYAL
jgi:hypothetical protein